MKKPGRPGPGFCCLCLELKERAHRIKGNIFHFAWDGPDATEISLLNQREFPALFSNHTLKLLLALTVGAGPSHGAGLAAMA
jgi:hypothetical protein